MNIQQKNKHIYSVKLELCNCNQTEEETNMYLYNSISRGDDFE